MNLFIYPEYKAIEMSKTFKNKTSIISITCPDDDNVIFADNPNIISVFRMKFNDVTSEEYGIPVPVQDNFNGLKAFVDTLTCDDLVVHCGAGVSRSAAVAAAINDYLELGYNIFGNINYHPNHLVYSLACTELGILKDENYWNKIFNKEE